MDRAPEGGGRSGVDYTIDGVSCRVFDYFSGNKWTAFQILETLLAMGAADLRVPTCEITSLDPAEAVAGIAEDIVITGIGLSEGVVTVNGVNMPVTLNGGDLQFTLDVNIPAGTYDVLFTSGPRSATLTNGLTLT